MQMDELLYGIAELVKRYAVIYLVDIDQVPDFNKMYEFFISWFKYWIYNTLIYAIIDKK